jgi:hypothetical protein
VPSTVSSVLIAFGKAIDGRPHGDHDVRLTIAEPAYWSGVPTKVAYVVCEPCGWCVSRELKMLAKSDNENMLDLARASKDLLDKFRREAPASCREAAGIVATKAVHES